MLSSFSISSVLPTDIEFLQIQLERCTWLAEELDITLSKQDAMQRPGSYTGGTDAANERSMYNGAAFNEISKLLSVLRDWRAAALRLPGLEVAKPKPDRNGLFAIDTIASVAQWLIVHEVPKRMAMTDQYSTAYSEILRAMNQAAAAIDLPTAATITPMPWTKFPVERLDDILLPKQITRDLAPFTIEVTTKQISTWGKDGALEVHEREHLDGLMKRYYCR